MRILPTADSIPHPQQQGLCAGQRAESTTGVMDEPGSIARMQNAIIETLPGSDTSPTQSRPRRVPVGRRQSESSTSGAYKLLAGVIARASVRHLRRTVSGNPLKQQPVSAIKRPSIQTRRSVLRSPGESATSLHFDRKIWESTPPLQTASVEQGDYFAPFKDFKAEICFDEEIPRAASAPVRHSADFHGDSHHRPNAGSKSRTNPLNFAPYFQPQMTRALESRAPQSTRKQGIREVSYHEVEWSFLLPLAKVISAAITPPINVLGSCRVAEYGCWRATPNPALKSVVDAIHRQSPAMMVPISHDCPTNFDIRPLRVSLSSSPLSYCGQQTLSSFSFSEFGDVVCSLASIDIGIGGRDLFQLFGIPPSTVGSFSAAQRSMREELAERNLVTWLSARATEVKPGGVLVIHLPIQISQPMPRSPYNPAATERRQCDEKNDLWTSMLRNLEPAVQRLVSLGEVRNHIAPMLLDVAYWPRSWSSVRRSLEQLEGWEVLPGEANTPWREWDDLGVRVHRLPYPAWTALTRGEIGREEYARRVATYCRSVYELHFKQVLRERGKIDIGQSEMIVQNLV